MPAADPAVLRAFRLQARACAEMGSPFTAALLDHAADALETGGPLAELVGGWAGDPIAAALALRVAGALHALVLEGAEPELAGAYPRLGRAGCDQAPLNASEPADRLRLRAFVWADQFARLARLEAALDLAQARGAPVEKADAAEWITARLTDRAADGLTVIYHSVFWQYPPAATREAIAAALTAAGGAASPGAPRAWLRFEPEIVRGGPRAAGLFHVTLTTWPGGEERRLAEVDPHGRWVAWSG